MPQLWNFEVGLRAEATKSLVLGFARVDEQPKVDRAPIRALAKAAVKPRRVFDKAAKQAAQQGGSCPPRRDIDARPRSGISIRSRPWMRGGSGHERNAARNLDSIPDSLP